MSIRSVACDPVLSILQTLPQNTSAFLSPSPVSHVSALVLALLYIYTFQ